MTKSLRVGLTCFGLSYVALSLLAAWLLPDHGWLATGWANSIIVCAVVALCSVLIGLAAGRLAVASTAICGLLIYLAVFAVTIGLSAWISSRGTGNLVWPPLLGPALGRHWLGLLASAVAGIAWPVIWLLAFRRIAPRLAPSLVS